MKLSVVFSILAAVVLFGALAYYGLPRQNEFTPAPQTAIIPEAGSIESEISDSLIARFIAEDEGIQAALTNQIPKSATGSGESVTEATPKSNQDLLFELMAPWVYVKYRKVNQIEQAQFFNTYNRKTSPYLPIGGTLEGAIITKLDSDKATVKLADATQELLYVSLTPPPFDPTVPRTPEQIKEAQRRYYETVYKPSVVMGRKYNELAGRPANMNVPPRREQIEQGLDYLNLMEERVQNAQTEGQAPGPLVDISQLTDKQREAYEAYRSAIQRSPEEIRAAIDDYRQRLLQQRQDLDSGNAVEEPAAPSE